MTKQAQGDGRLPLLVLGVIVGFLIIGYSLSEEALGMLNPPEDCMTGWGPCTDEDIKRIQTLGFCFLSTGLVIVGACSFTILMIKTPKIVLEVENDSNDSPSQEE